MSAKSSCSSDINEAWKAVAADVFGVVAGGFAIGGGFALAWTVGAPAALGMVCLGIMTIEDNVTEIKRKLSNFKPPAP